MTEEPGIIQMNIVRYQEMLKHRLDDLTRARVTQLLSEATGQLAVAIDLKRP